MSNLDQTTQMILIIIGGAIFVLFVLIIVYIIIKLRDKKNSKSFKSEGEETNKNKVSGVGQEGKQSVFNFLEFDKVEDNMIVQKEGRKYIMAIECQGVNYDLMSGVEKTGVEEGFVQFLNTLRYPIQIYIQTRTVNLEASINGYKEKVENIQKKLMKMRVDYQEMIESHDFSKENKDKLFFEITKQTNLYEYGKDIIYDTEKMSLNKNILNKKYYIIISYYASEIGKNEFDKSEIQSMAFSELYTRAQAIIRAISSCGVNGKILDSIELSELLYVSYNRDESETFNLKQAIKAEYDKLYSTAPDVLQRKIKELDKSIEDKAVEKVEEMVEKYKSKYREKVEEKEQSIEELADEMAQLILKGNEKYLGEDVVEEILQEGGMGKNEEKKKRTRKTSNAKS